MTLPPFPSQDLAKLVLGYLAEEQLMTAYDEFLQASPYLDALRNEYDRIFMTSLKSILAEYRAVKIYVETCKPLPLRKKLLQCTNLLDVVKFLAINSDINKIQAQDTSLDKFSLVKQHTSIASSKQNVCEDCNSSNLSSCVCKNKQKPNVHSASHVGTGSVENSVETTALEDLPGNHVANRKKHVRVDKDASESNNILGESTKQSSNVSINSSSGPNSMNFNTHDYQLQSTDNCSLSLGSIVKATDTPECREKIEEFNSILHKVCSNKSKVDTRLFTLPETENVNNIIPNASTFQDFASGVCGENINIPVPDSSTSENSTTQISVAKDTNKDASSNLSDLEKSANENTDTQTCSNYPYSRIKPKCMDQKIKIISDIKVGKTDRPFTAGLPATSTPLMQTIVINGTPAYKQQLPVVSSNYTKDEIMAMPTIIVVPASGPPPHMAHAKPTVVKKLQQVKTKTVLSSKSLSPLVIDVTSSNAAEKKISEENQPNTNIHKPEKDTGLVKTVDSTKNASVPKDNIIAGSHQNNTPHVPPPVRKSSSTPRRNSHIRVLDFTTPRRILHETISEIVPNDEKSTDDKSVDIVVTRSPKLVFPETGNDENNIIDMSNVKVHKIETCHISKLKNDDDTKQQIINKKNNWDADLRALAIASDQNYQPPIKPKPRIRKPKKKVDDQAKEGKEIDKSSDKTDEKKEKKSRSKRKLSPKPRKSNKKQKKLEEEEKLFEESASASTVETKVAIKPTFNVVAANNYNQPEDSKVVESNHNKVDNEDIHETPEAERLSLQNEIGSRLNISEFLETPYKQVLYDIQMETPKFLGSVLPDEPISDIKIMNIPTPRFFDTPKLAQATPSSYSSRPTDYSSGGSYYKPDDQDYLRIPDIECPVTSSKEEPHMELPNETVTSNKRTSRPVRKCTKNVSYVNLGSKTKEKEFDDKVEIASSCSDCTSANSSFDNNKDVIVKTPKSDKLKINKSGIKKRLESSRKRKSPMKKDKLHSFMKIKPRRLTPTKDVTNKRTRRKTDIFSQNISSKTQVKRKSVDKDKNSHITPLVAPAPTKSRRKSSTPRKLHCTKTFNSESSGHESPDINASAKTNDTRDQNLVSTVSSHDSDTEHMALRWSDDGSQDAKPKEGESEDISKIQEYIETSGKSNDFNDKTGTLHVDLIKRGFDAETAKSIERDLLDPTSPCKELISQTCIESKKDEKLLDKSLETDTSVTNELHIVQDEDSEDEFELSGHECNEGSDNYFICSSSEAKDKSKEYPIKLKDKFSMEVCIDDGVAIRLRATNFNMLFENDPDNEEELTYSFRETEVAVSSISNIDKLYTPLKDHKEQCYEIFDSTLTSLDTPLKVNSPKFKEQRVTEIEIILEEEKAESKADIKKRKRLQSNYSSKEPLNESKKTKPEAQYLFNSTNIQNIDIESVLKKLHGP